LLDFTLAVLVDSLVEWWLLCCVLGATFLCCLQPVRRTKLTLASKRKMEFDVFG